MRKARNAQRLYRRVWRVSAEAPLGEVVEIEIASETDPTEVSARRPEASNSDVPRDFGWRQSSLELSDGLEVSENEDTVPAELWDELFKK